MALLKILFAALGIVIGVVPWTVAALETDSDPEAVAIANQVLEALGGEDAWQETRYIRFTFVRGDERLTLTWDKWTGRYRLDAKTEEGQPFVVLMNVNTGKGEVYLDRRPLSGEEREKYLARAHRMWAGETYWLLMPYKLKDPGVELRYEGEETLDGSVYDVLHVSFENVGLTPGDQFWAYIHRETHLMDKWRFVLESGYEGEFWWRDWERYGDILLSRIRETPEGQVAIRMEDIVVTQTLPDRVFISPKPVELP